MTTLRVVFITDARFSNSKDDKIQLGFLVLMVDEEGITNIVQYGYSRRRKITRSVMAAEHHALILGFDFSYVIRETIV